MIKIPYEKIIEKIKEQAKLDDSEIASKIKEKSDQLAGLISKEGAAHIIANELGVKLFEEGNLKIKDIVPGMRSVETNGKVTNVFELREFQRKDGSPGKVASFIIADESSRARVVLWNDQTDLLKDIKEGSIIKITNGFSKENNGNVEIHTASKSEITINPEGVQIEATAQGQKTNRKSIKDLAENDSNIELLATIVQVFEPRFYEVCPECNKRLKQKESKLACDTHGEVAPGYGFVMNAVIDDGTETIRTVFFKNQLINLLKTDEAGVIKFKDSPADFQEIKDSLPGTIIKVIGRTSKNEMFDRLEFITQLVFPDPSPDEELKKLQEEAKVIE